MTKITKKSSRKGRKSFLKNYSKVAMYLVEDMLKNERYVELMIKLPFLLPFIVLGELPRLLKRFKFKLNFSECAILIEILLKIPLLCCLYIVSKISMYAFSMVAGFLLVYCLYKGGVIVGFYYATKCIAFKNRKKEAERLLRLRIKREKRIAEMREKGIEPPYVIFESGIYDKLTIPGESSKKRLRLFI